MNRPLRVVDTQTLRQNAEQQLRHEPQGIANTAETMSPELMQILIHELRVHQIELELQNEELRRKQAELDSSRSMYFTLYHHAPIGYCTLNSQGLILESNLAVCNLLGVTRSSIAMARFRKFIVPDDQDVFYRHRHQLMISGKTESCELRLRHNDGITTWVQLDSNTSQGADNAFLQRIMLTDITAIKAAESKLRTREEFHVSIFDSLSKNIAVLDENGVIIAVNEAWRRYARDNGGSTELANPIGVNYLQICNLPGRECSRTDSAQLLTGIQAVLEGRQSEFSMEYPCHSPDQNRWFHVQVTRMLGLRPGLIVSHQDVTNRKTAELALDESRRELAMVASHVPGPVARIDRNLRYRFANHHYQHFFGRSHDQVIGHLMPEVLGDDLFQQVEPFTRRALAGEKVTFDSVYWSPDDKACHFLVNYVPDLDADQNVIGFFVLAIDITERKHADAARKSLESQLRESQKMEALGTLSSGIAHDFNNALAAILGNAELAQKEIRGNELLAQYLGEIYRSGIRSRNLVQQILSYCRQQPTELRRLALAAVIHDAMAMLKATLPVRFSLIVHCAAEPSWILADKTQIEQVIINLVTNAAQAIGSQAGTIEIGVELINANAPELAICPLPAGPFDHTCRVVRLSVSDDGPGIAPQIQDRLFEPFFTTKPLGEGTGLGLSVVQGIVTVHGASIHVDSELGKGTKFSIDFPEVVGDTADRPLENEPYQHTLTTDAVAAVSVAAVSVAAGTVAAGTVAASNVAVVDRPIPNESRHVLLIDDDASVLKMSTLMLERMGYTVSAYDNPLAALDAVRNDPTAFQIVITDYNMPVMPGLEIAAAVRDLCPNLPVVVISGFIDDQLRTGAARAGVAELISKPFTVRDFSAKIERVLS